MPDDELRQIRRHDLGDLARQCFDREVLRRGLDISRQDPSGEARPDGLVTVASFRYQAEAQVARALLESASIPAYIEHQHTIVAYGLGELHLMVPGEAVEDALAVLRSRVSQEDLDAQAEAAPKPPDV